MECTNLHGLREREMGEKKALLKSCIIVLELVQTEKGLVVGYQLLGLAERGKRHN